MKGIKRPSETGIFTSKRDETGKVTGSEKWLSEADKAAKNKAENKTESKAAILARLEQENADFTAKLAAIQVKHDNDPKLIEARRISKEFQDKQRKKEEYYRNQVIERQTNNRKKQTNNRKKQTKRCRMGC